MFGLILDPKLLLRARVGAHFSLVGIKQMSFYRIFGVLAVLFLSSLPSFAQTTTGDILGTVRDASGGLVTDAKVIVRNLDTNQSKETTTSGTGNFRVPLLSTGSYEVLVAKTGFSTYRQGPIVLAVNQEADLNITLAVSGTTETARRWLFRPTPR